jgi:hypothetical protein
MEGTALIIGVTCAGEGKRDTTTADEVLTCKVGDSKESATADDEVSSRCDALSSRLMDVRPRGSWFIRHCRFAAALVRLRGRAATVSYLISHLVTDASGSLNISRSKFAGTASGANAWKGAGSLPCETIALGFVISIASRSAASISLCGILCTGFDQANCPLAVISAGSASTRAKSVPLLGGRPGGHAASPEILRAM